MFDIVMEQARRSGAKKIVAINLVIGAMTGVVGDSVRFYMDFIGKDTIAEKAELNIKTIPAKVRCRNCENEFDLEEFNWSCPQCGDTDLEITHGKELFVESIEVD